MKTKQRIKSQDTGPGKRRNSWEHIPFLRGDSESARDPTGQRLREIQRRGVKQRKVMARAKAWQKRGFSREILSKKDNEITFRESTIKGKGIKELEILKDHRKKEAKSSGLVKSTQGKE